MDIYQEVQELRSKDPELTINDACKQLNASPHMYQYYRKKNNGLSRKKKKEQKPGRPKGSKNESPKDINIKHRKIKLQIPTQATGTDGKLIVLMGSPEQIKEVLQ